MTADLLQSHLAMLLIFSGLSATALAVVYRPPGRRLRYGARIFAAFTLGTIVAAWAMAWLGR